MKSEQQGERKSRRFMRQREVENRSGLPTSTMYEKIGKGTFPPPVPIGARAVAWIEDEVDDWIASMIEASRGAEAAASKEAVVSKKGSVSVDGLAPSIPELR